MDFAPSTVWWLLGATLVALELATGTFYLLMLALGAAAGAVAAHAGVSPSMQIIIGGVVAAGAVIIWSRIHKRSGPAPLEAMQNRDVNLDIGERVAVSAWNADKTSKAVYRGSEWLVRYGGEDTPGTGEFRIVALEGNRLIVKK
jgi:membrane protein implicated in regulation of membrane protease activity